VVSHELTIYNDSKDPKPQIRELQKEVGFLTRDLNMCTEYVESQHQNPWHDESYGRSTPLSPQLQLPSQPWDHSDHPSGLGVPLPVMQEDGSLFNKPSYDTAMDGLRWPGNILDKNHPHWKQKPPPGPIRGLLAIMGNGLITIACLILLMMIMFIMGHLVVSIFSVSSTSLQKIKDAVVPKKKCSRSRILK
jgi:Na+-transporting methylmalonyl-CoA/oxaloacetate decarboxylase gamma subunit